MTIEDNQVTDELDEIIEGAGDDEVIDGTESEDITEGAEGDEVVEGAEGSDEGELEVPPRGESRGSKRIQALHKEREAEKEARIRAEAELEVLKRQQNAPAHSSVNAEAEARAEAERLSVMDPTEKAIYLQSKELRQMKEQMLFSQLQMADSADKSDYLTKAAVNPVYAKHSEAVEQRLAEFRRNGVNPTRKQVLALLIGEAALDTKPKTQAKQQAATRVAASQAKPTQAKGAVGAKTDSVSDLEKRLANVKF